MVGGTSDVAGDLAWLLSEAGYKVYFSGSIHLPTMVAAHPDLGDPIPVRTQHSVLTSTEISIKDIPDPYGVKALIDQHRRV